MPIRTKISGQRGRWLAEVNGTWLAVLHDTWRVGPTGYYDPMEGAKLDGKRYSEFVAALRAHDAVVLQKDKEGSFEREAYIGVFGFTDLDVGADGAIRLTLTKRLADPR